MTLTSARITGATSLLIIAMVTFGSGCGKKAETTGQTGMATQGDPRPVTENYPGIDLDQMTRDLKRWIVSTKQRPGTFEEYVAKTKITVPPAPAGKKFVISKQMRVTLVDR
jgi:hypothetical protein